MNTMMRRLLLLLLILLLAGCAQTADPQPQPTMPPPPDTPAAEQMHAVTATAPPQEAPELQETAELPPLDTPAPTLTAPPPTAPAQDTATAVPPTETPEPVDPAELLTLPRLQNMTYTNLITPGGEVTLANGLYKEQAAPGSAAQIRVTLDDTIAYGDVGGEYHAALILVSDGGGTGTFYTLHLVGVDLAGQEEDQPSETAAILLGDRVRLHDLAIVDGRIEVELTRAGPDDPLCCPTERVRQVYALRGDGLILVEETFIDAQPANATAPGSTADLVDRGLDLNVSGVAGMYAWTIERIAPQADPPLPAYLLMTFDAPTSEELLTGNAPLLAIYPVDPYLRVDGSAGEQIDRLWLLAETDFGPGGAPAGWMPLLPPPNAPVEDWSGYAPLDFIHGLGLRYLRLLNGELAYTYVGITEDGRYAVTLTWPLGGDTAPSLKALDAMIATLALGVPPVEP